MIVTSPVTKAMPSDKDEVLSLCQEDHAENGQFGLSLSKVSRTVSSILEGSEGVIGVIRRKDTIESLIMMRIGQFWYTDDWCLEETMNYVRPQFRKSTNAKDMIVFGKRCSDELPLPLVIGVVSNVRTQAKMALYQRQLGNPVGGYFYYSKTKPLPSAHVVESGAVG